MSGKQNDLQNLMTFEQYIHWMDKHLSELYPHIVPGFQQTLKDWISLSFKWARYEEFIIEQNKKELPNADSPTTGSPWPQRG